MGFIHYHEKEDGPGMRILLAIVLTALILTGFGCTKQAIDDSAVTAKVKAGLAADKNTSAIKISVETHGGVVTMTGVVPTETEKITAGQIAKNTEGVRSVVNNITVDPHSIGATNIGNKVGEAAEQAKEKIGEATASAREALSDAAILAQVKAEFVANGITGTNVEVTNGEVTIKGEVESAGKKAKAEEIARRIKGVTKVKNQLTVKR